MTKQELINSIAEDRAREDAALAIFPDGLNYHLVASYSRNNAAAHIDVQDYDEAVRALHACRKQAGGYVLERYYSHNDCLVLVYTFGALAASLAKLNLVIYCHDLNGALAKVSDGKCSVETFTETTTDTRIVCNSTSVA